MGHQPEAEHFDPTGKSELELFGLAPKDAQHRLEVLGLNKDGLETANQGTRGFLMWSHEVRALITIAKGTAKRFLGEVYREMREQDGLPPID